MKNDPRQVICTPCRQGRASCYGEWLRRCGGHLSCGKIVRSGTHEQLMEQDGLYRRFVESGELAVGRKAYKRSGDRTAEI